MTVWYGGDARWRAEGGTLDQSLKSVRPPPPLERRRGPAQSRGKQADPVIPGPSSPPPPPFFVVCGPGQGPWARCQPRPRMIGDDEKTDGRAHRLAWTTKAVRPHSSTTYFAGGAFAGGIRRWGFCASRAGLTGPSRLEWPAVPRVTRSTAWGSRHKDGHFGLGRGAAPTATRAATVPVDSGRLGFGRIDGAAGLHPTQPTAWLAGGALLPIYHDVKG